MTLTDFPEGDPRLVDTSSYGPQDLWDFAYYVWATFGDSPEILEWRLRELLPKVKRPVEAEVDEDALEEGEE